MTALSLINSGHSLEILPAKIWKSVTFNCKLKCSNHIEEIYWAASRKKNALSTITAQKMKFSIKDFFSKCDQIRKKLQIWSHLLKKFLMENFIFCAVNIALDWSSWKKMAHKYFLRDNPGIFRTLLNIWNGAFCESCYSI